MPSFIPGNVDKESERAAELLQNFLDKNKLPREAIANAKGVAIYSAIRAGMYLAGSGGSGVVVARLPNGSWSFPSAFSVKSGGVGIVYGVDFYDCVCVLNTQAAVEAYSKPEVALGTSVAVAAGPMNGSVDLRQGSAKPVWIYTKSRGLYGGLTIDGTSIKERAKANADFFGRTVTAAQILAGEVEPTDGNIVSSAGVELLTRVLSEAIKVPPPGPKESSELEVRPDSKA